MSDNCPHCETREHIDKVRLFLGYAANNLTTRGRFHDQSKLLAPEAEGFANCTKALKGLTYGSDEYKAQLAEMKPFLDHHYRENRHHPEHHADGVLDMNYLDILEMLCDWAAATERHNDGCLVRSLQINAERFNIPPVMQRQLEATANVLFHEKIFMHEIETCPCFKKS